MPESFSIPVEKNGDGRAQRVDQAIGQLPRFSGGNADNNQGTVAPAVTRLLTEVVNAARRTVPEGGGAGQGGRGAAQGAA